VSGLPSRLPPGFWAVRYVGARFPGSQAVVERPGIADGANCQLFAYEVLRHFGLEVPALRSSELWADTTATTPVSEARPLDLVLFNATGDAWGAHVGVWIEDDQVLHLCAEVGRPVVWRMDEFAARDRYRTVIGIKRVVRSAGMGGTGHS
jgi:cell wall-associated NlpC family hydrolase